MITIERVRSKRSVMIMRIRMFVMAFLISLGTISVASAQRRPRLEVGSSAPQLTVDWIKGSFESGDVPEW